MRSGPALCFVHGTACRPDDWDALQRLLSKDYVCSAPDLGFFDSGAGQRDSMEIAAMARRVTAEVSGDTILIGHSLGCRVALQAAMDRRQQTKALVLVEGSRLSDLEPSVMLEPIAADPEAFMEDFFGQMMGPKMPPALGRTLIDRAKRVDGEALAQSMTALLRWDREEGRLALAALQDLPILVMQSSTLGSDGKRRPLRAGETNPWIDTIREECPRAKVVTLSGYGHFPMIEDPEAIAGPLRDFLASL